MDSNANDLNEIAKRIADKVDIGMVDLPDGDHSSTATTLQDIMKSYVFKGAHFPNPAILNNPKGFSTLDYPETNYNMPCREDDVFVASYPKCGNTWTREVVTLIMHDPDVLREDKRNIEVRAPEIGHRWKGYDYVPYEEMKSPRVFKTHYPLHCFPKEAIEKKCKIVYISRNFKDYAVSAYHFWGGLLAPDGKTKVVQGNMRDLMVSTAGSTGAFWSYFGHTAAFWKHRNCGQILFIFYEDMIKDPFAVVRKITDFLEKPLTDEQLSKIVVETSFDKMKANPLANMEFLSSTGFKAADDVPFMRKGKVGNWKENFDDEMKAIADELCRRHFEPIGLTHVYAL